MSELELKITVGSVGSNIGDLVRRLYIDGENSGEGLVLASDAYTLGVVKLERMDGLPLTVEEDFNAWVQAEHLPQDIRERDIALKAYLAGRAVK